MRNSNRQPYPIIFLASLVISCLSISCSKTNLLPTKSGNGATAIREAISDKGKSRFKFTFTFPIHSPMTNPIAKSEEMIDFQVTSSKSDVTLVWIESKIRLLNEKPFFIKVYYDESKNPFVIEVPVGPKPDESALNEIVKLINIINIFNL